MNRLKNLPTLHIDAERALSFTYRGKTLQGLAGDTVATALYAILDRPSPAGLRQGF